MLWRGKVALVINISNSTSMDWAVWIEISAGTKMPQCDMFHVAVSKKIVNKNLCDAQ